MRRVAQCMACTHHLAGPENPSLIQFQINHNFSFFSHPCTSFHTSSILVAFIHILALMCILSCSCVSFCMSSILIASIRILASMHALSCSVCWRFSAVTCMSHVLQCVRTHSAACCLAAVPASEAAHAQPMELLVCIAVLLALLVPV